MDKIDALGNQYTGFKNLTKDLLAETDDAELQDIVKSAAEELNSPMALVSFVLDQIQFFKAQVGLPAVLAHTRGTHRDASFCQFVVRDGDVFEVNDALNDDRIPKHVVNQYGIQSYLGVPIKINDEVVGSLCVLDNKKRQFKEREFKRLKQLSLLVNKRLEELTTNRRQSRIDLTYSTLDPALKELSRSLKQLPEHVKTAYSQATSIRSFLAMFEHVFYRKSDTSDAIKLSFEAASQASKRLSGELEEIELSAMDGKDCLDAMENLVSSFDSVKLSEIVTSAQDLCRNATRSVGGFPLPDFKSDPIIKTKENLATAIISNCLLLLCSELRNHEFTKGIKLQIIESEKSVALYFSAFGLNREAIEQVEEQLRMLTGEKHPTVSILTDDSSLKVEFKTEIAN